MIACILAAGRGVRMNSALPKVVWPLLGRPVLEHVRAQVRPFRPRRELIVVSRARGPVENALDPQGATFIIQPKPLGTADAVRRCLPYLVHAQEEVLVLCGDVPLLSRGTLCLLLRAHRRARAELTLLTTRLPDPKGYGRIVRGPGARIEAIVEEKDADRPTREIAEINVGVYAFAARALRESLRAVKRSPVSGEYYLTEAVRFLVRQGRKVATVLARDWRETVGINTPEQFEAARALLGERFLRSLRARDVTVCDPTTTRIDVTCRIGRGTEIRPFSLLEGKTRVGKGCRIGPFVWLVDASVKDNEEVAWVVLKS